jgi:hypothetical protein
MLSLAGVRPGRGRVTRAALSAGCGRGGAGQFYPVKDHLGYPIIAGIIAVGCIQVVASKSLNENIIEIYFRTLLKIPANSGEYPIIFLNVGISPAFMVGKGVDQKNRLWQGVADHRPNIGFIFCDADHMLASQPGEQPGAAAGFLDFFQY